MEIFKYHIEDFHASPLISDFFRFYQLSIFDFLNKDNTPKVESLFLLLNLIYFLPENSSTKNQQRGGEPFTFSDQMLSKIEYLTNINLQSKRKKNSHSKTPELIIPDYVRENQRKQEEEKKPERINLEDLTEKEMHEYILELNQKLGYNK